jgi:hypothetical protein
VEVLLFPNGDREILIRDAKRGYAMRLKVSVGPAEMSLTVSRTTLGTPLSVIGNQEGDYEPIRLEGDAAELSITQYNGDTDSQAYKAWALATPFERRSKDLTRPVFDGDPQCGGAVR